MKGYKLVTTAALLAASMGAVSVPSSAAARSHSAPDRTHQSKRHGHQAKTVTFYARVVRSSAQGLIVRGSDGRILRFAAKQILRTKLPAKSKHHRRGRHGLHAAVDMSVSSGNVVVNILGLQPGVLIQITETTDDAGNITITITLPPQSGSESTSGVVSEVNEDAFMVQTSDGTNLRLHMAADALASLGLQSCETVDVTYHQDAGILLADNVTNTGSSTSGDCVPKNDATGTITEVSADGLTISTDQGPVSFNVDPSSGLTDGYQAGDLVDVTYTENSDGTRDATDMQFVEEDASGQVTSVTTSTNGGSLTIIDDDNGRSETFNADPNHGVQINGRAFNGVSVGDRVGLTYHQSAGQLTADTVTER